MKKIVLLFCVLSSLYGSGQVGMYHGVRLIESEGQTINGSFKMVVKKEKLIDDTILVYIVQRKMVITGEEGGTYFLTPATTASNLQTYDAQDLQGKLFLIYWKDQRRFEDGNDYFEIDIMHDNISKTFLCKVFGF